jgi:hypothetical protein
MQIYPTLEIFFGNSWGYDFNNKLWFAFDQCNRLISFYFPAGNLFKLNCFIKMKDRL